MNSTFLNKPSSNQPASTTLSPTVVANLIRAAVTHRLRHWAQQTKTPLVEPILIRLLAGAIAPLLYLGVVYAAIDNLNLHPILDRTVDAAALYGY